MRSSNSTHSPQASRTRTIYLVLSCRSGSTRMKASNIFLRADGLAGGLTPLSTQEASQRAHFTFFLSVSPVKKFAFDSWETLGKSAAKPTDYPQLASRASSPKISLGSESNEKRKRRVRFNDVLCRDLVSDLIPVIIIDTWLISHGVNKYRVLDN